MPLSLLPVRMPELPKDQPVYVICQAGGRSAQATALMRAVGIDDEQCRGRDRASGSSPRRPVRDRSLRGAQLITVLPLDTPGLGRPQLPGPRRPVAVVVDPQRDIDRILAWPTGSACGSPTSSRPTSTTTTSPAASRWPRATGAAYLRQRRRPRSPSTARRCATATSSRSAPMRVRVLATPGHTFPHLSYVLERRRRAGRRCSPAARCCSAPPAAPTCSARSTPTTLAHAQHASAHRLADVLPDDAAVWPTHGFGSFCSATQSDGDRSRPSARRSSANPALTARRAGLRRRPARRPGRLPRLLRAHGAGQRRRPGRAGPVPAARRPGRTAPPDRRPASGWSTCATARRSPPATSPAR